ncbi:MAG TPA: hypothetical protein VFP12_04910 [Allosphingosinicella sp.]|nr:hypothetical protein [Allosphingosinicella sp.]
MTAGLAYFTQGTADGAAIPVHFNPTSLRVALTNQFGEDPPEQHARATTAKLDVELLFDTTHDGSDVRSATAALRALAVATGVTAPPSGQQQQQASGSLPKAFFHWGTTTFEGLIESLTETLDFWSSDGVPLRASITLSMKGSELKSSAYTASAMATNIEAPALVDFVPVPAMNGASGAAAAGGDPGAGRFLAALNGMESMRAGASAGASLSASASINLSAAASFSMSGGVSAGASAGLSAGAGIGVGAGASAGASASAGLSASVGVGMAAGASAGVGLSAGAGASFGASAGASAGFGVSAGASFGASAGAGGFSSSSVSYSGSASAGISASQGAFAALGSSKTTLPSGSFSLDKLLPPPAPAVGPNAQFDSTGKVVSAGGQVAASYTASASAGVTFF